MSCIVRSMTLVYNVRNFRFGYASSVYSIRAMPIELLIPMISSNISEEFLPHISLESFRLDFGCQIVDYIVGVKNGYDGITTRKFSEIVFPKEIVKRRIQLS